MSEEYEQYLRISSTDGKNTVESIINDLKKQVSKGQVEFGIDCTVERVTVDDIISVEDYETETE